jgi:hypothetical protein
LRRTQGANTDSLARAVFALLVLACFVAFFLTQRLKHTPTAVQRFELTPFFSPTPAGHIKQERISFRIARSDEVTVTVIDSGGTDVAELLRDHFVTRYKQLSLRWNGRRGSAHGYIVIRAHSPHPVLVANNRGPLARPGEYRIRVSLRQQRRSLFSPRTFKLVWR